MCKKILALLMTSFLFTGCSRNVLPNASYMSIDKSVTSFNLKKDDITNNINSDSTQTSSLDYSGNEVTLSKQKLENKDLYQQPNNATISTSSDYRSGVEKLQEPEYSDNVIYSSTNSGNLFENNNKVVAVNSWDKSLSLNQGDSEQIDARASFRDGSSVNSLNWHSSDESVAKVDNNGNVTAVSDGDATITVTSTDDFSKKTEIPVTVKDNN